MFSSDFFFLKRHFSNNTLVLKYAFTLIQKFTLKLLQLLTLDISIEEIFIKNTETHLHIQY